ncbi:ABC transporter permease [Mobilitalea sibirica]|uniref:ABC transporter permease n=1 Tax=Mobilitalea sibirica TaxID=1462919 RepID=A0A8J7KUR8_9FIRM|nr:ABC transporter permease [Mobilitalea sibirica]MBH1939310.1 ABC transporter permease [Mobilitalea sibirica]
MYAKLALRNARKSMKDYLIYIVTLMICVGLFYSFMSISSRYYVSSLPVEYDLKLLQNLMRYPVIGITAVLIFLVKYVNNYILRRKQKEFAIQTLLGMEQKSVAFLFFVETLIMGLISIVIGIILGAFFSQVLTSNIMSFFEEEYHMYFSLFPDTVLITVIGFCAVFILIGFLNIRKIRKMKIVDMLRANKELQDDMKKEFLMPFMILVMTAISINKVMDGLLLYKQYKDVMILGSRGFMDVVSFYGNLILPLFFAGTVAMYLILCIIKRKLLSIQKLIIILTGFTILIIAFALMIVAGHPLMDRTTTNGAYMYVMIYLVFFMFAVFYSLSTLMQIFKTKSKRWKYKGNTLFIVGQINARLTSNTRTMSILAGTILLAITTFIVDPILSGWAMGYLKERAVYDIQIATEGNSKTTLNTLPDGDFTYVEETLEEMGIVLKDSLKVEFYYLNDKEFVEGSFEQPIMAISLSDYNHLRAMAGSTQIDLKENEFSLQWHYSVTEEEIEKYLKENKTITINNENLVQANEIRHREKLGEAIYSFSSDTSVVIIIPDILCKSLLIGKCNYYGNAMSKMSYETAQEINAALNQKIEQISKDHQYYTELRMRTKQRNEGISVALLTKLLLFYGGIVLFVISFTVLSLHQLADSSDFKHRFQIIKKMGVSDTSINGIILSQMGIWFGLPILFAGISAIITGRFYMKWTEVIINTLIGSKEFYDALFKMMMIIIVLFVSYFVSTWVLFKKNIELY